MVDYTMKEITTCGGGGRKHGGAAPPCAACKLLRRRCAKDCVFAPYFPADEPQKFASVHKVFGASNVNKMLQELAEDQRGDAVSSMVYEANARVRDPVYGCVGAISSLQQQIDLLQTQLALAQAEVVQMRMRMRQYSNNSSTISTSPDHHYYNNHNNSNDSPSSSRHTHSHNSRRSIFSMEANMEDTFWSS